MLVDGDVGERASERDARLAVHAEVSWLVWCFFVWIHFACNSVSREPASFGVSGASAWLAAGAPRPYAV